ncbi:MAG TPA: GAF domain-containing protein [Pseudonocardiaceae bacterium]|nr:GAF domain-containing protein [Pseudonocardiaceae bacterium]
MRSSRDLIDADYGVLDVLGADQRLTEFCRVGVDDELPGRMDVLPAGTADHPVTRASLDVRVWTHGVHFGDLHLGRKQGGAAFTEEDEFIVGALAAAGGIAIDNARLFERTHQRELWLRASNEITGALLGGQHAPTALALVARQARTVARAQVAVVALPHLRTSDLVVGGADGAGTEHLVGDPIARADAVVGQVMVDRTSRLIDDLDEDLYAWLGGPAARSPGRNGRLGSAVLVPLAVGQYELGVLMVARPQDDPAFTEADLQLASTFAEHAALAIEFARAQEARQRVAVLEDRDRIARDLHDLVIQRLFAVGLGLRGLVKLAGTGPIADRASGFIVDLDQTIREVRRSIFSLHEVPAGQVSLRRDLLRAAEDAAGTLGFQPRADLTGALDSLVPDEVRPDLLATLREALSNVARHATASTVQVEVGVDRDGHRLRLVVRDDGRGAPPGLQRHSGLANLADRAARWGGSIDIDSAEGAGFALTWTVPLRSPDVTGP